MRRSAPPTLGPTLGPTHEFDAFSRPMPADQGDADDQLLAKDYSNPPWVKVWWTSVRLFIQRSPLRHRIIAALASLGVAVAVTAVAIALIRPASTADTDERSPAATNSLAAAAGVQSDAARWASNNVADGTLIACDPSTCVDLEAAGYLVTALVPIRGGGDLRRADLVLVTPALRAQVGPSFDDLVAPQPVAAFGSGDIAAQLSRVVVDGPDGYARRTAADRAARRAAGRELATAQGLDLSATARAQLERGDVDARILSVLPPLLARNELAIVRFTSSPEEPPGGPLRMVEIERIDGDSVTPGFAVLSEVGTFLDAQQPPFAPTSVDVVASSGGPALRIVYAAPSPLGLLDGLAPSLEDQ